MSSHTAFLTSHKDGTVTVDHADPVIWVSGSLLDRAASWVFPAEGRTVLQLDTAGEYLYRFIGWRPWPGPELAVYERIKP